MSEAVMETPPQPSALRLAGTLAGIAMMSGLLVVMTYELTKPRIEANERAALERAVFSVLPGAVTRVSYRLEEEGLREVEEGGELYGGYDAEGELVGYAIPGAARGYQDVIRLLYGYDPEGELVIGMTVLQSTETPGLGDKIIRDERFHENFRGLDVRLDGTGEGLANPVRVTKEGEKTNAWEIDGISGATVSSEAVGRAIRRSAEETLPRLQRHRSGQERGSAWEGGR